VFDWLCSSSLEEKFEDPLRRPPVCDRESGWQASICSFLACLKSARAGRGNEKKNPTGPAFGKPQLTDMLCGGINLLTTHIREKNSLQHCTRPKGFGVRCIPTKSHLNVLVALRPELMTDKPVAVRMS